MSLHLQKDYSMFKSKLILIFILSCFISKIHAQDFLFNNYAQHLNYINPANVGVDSMHNFSLTGRYRNQFWQGKTYSTFATYEQPICHNTNGIGGSAFFEKGENYYQYKINGIIGGKLKLTSNMSIRGGVTASYEFFHQDSIGFHGGFEEWYHSPEMNNSLFEFGVGTRYDWGILFVGFSIKELSGAVFGEPYDDYGNKKHPLKILNGGLNLKLSNSITISPSFLQLWQSDARSFQIGTDLSIKKRIFAGAGIFSNNAVSFRGGFCLKKKLSFLFHYYLPADNMSAAINGKKNFETEIKFAF